MIMLTDLLAALAAFMHRTNLVRLIHHEEHKFSFHKKRKDS